MAALIRCCLHVNPEEMEEDEFVKAWCQVKYYLEVTSTVKFE